jgi:exodeoxyribonuclease VII large subunit
LIDRRKHELQACQATLTALNPRAVLQRGYSITRTLPDHAIVRDSAVVRDGQPLEVLLAKGALQVKVLQKI